MAHETKHETNEFHVGLLVQSNAKYENGFALLVARGTPRTEVSRLQRQAAEYAFVFTVYTNTAVVPRVSETRPQTREQPESINLRQSRKILAVGTTMLKW